MPDVTAADEQYYSTTKVAKTFGVTPETVTSWIKRGLLDAVKINGYWKVKRSSMIEFANSKYGK